MTTRPEIPLFILSGLALVAIGVLTGLGDKVPDIFNVIAGAAVVGGASVTQPKSSS